MPYNNNLAKKNQINTFLNTYFNLFVVVFVSFLMLIAYFSILKPKVDSTTLSIEENISSHQKILQAEKSKLASLQAAINSYNNIDKTDLERVNKILPNDYDKEALYGEIEEIVTSHGFIPTSIVLMKEGEETKANNVSSGETGPVVKKVSENIGLIDVSLSIASIDYAGLKNLLNVLETNLRLLDVREVSMGAGNSATLKMTTYFYKK